MCFARFLQLTADMTAESTVEYGTTSGSYTNSATGNATFYKYSASYTSGLIHHVTLEGLTLNTQVHAILVFAVNETLER